MKKNKITFLLLTAMISLSFVFLRESNKNSFEQLSINKSLIQEESDSLSSNSIEILRVGNFSGDNIDTGVMNLDWLGLFVNDGMAFLKKVDVSINNFHDPIIDNDNEATGKKIDVNDENKPILLISGLSKIKMGNIQTVEFKKSFLFPGEYISMKYQDIWTTFSAFGIVNLGEPIKSYKLQVSSTKDNHTSNQIIAETIRGFDDTQYKFIWAGDLDNDGSLDLLMDISEKYSYEEYALFLSSYAETGEIMKKVAVFRAVY